MIHYVFKHDQLSRYLCDVTFRYEPNGHRPVDKKVNTPKTELS